MNKFSKLFISNRYNDDNYIYDILKNIIDDISNQHIHIICDDIKYFFEYEKDRTDKLFSNFTQEQRVKLNIVRELVTSWGDITKYKQYFFTEDIAQKVNIKNTLNLNTVNFYKDSPVKWWFTPPSLPLQNGCNILYADVKTFLDNYDYYKNYLYYKEITSDIAFINNESLILYILKNPEYILDLADFKGKELTKQFVDIFKNELQIMLDNSNEYIKFQLMKELKNNHNLLSKVLKLDDIDIEELKYRDWGY